MVSGEPSRAAASADRQGRADSLAQTEELTGWWRAWVERRDIAAFTALAMAFGPMIRSVSRRRLGSDSAADEAWQDVLIALAARAHQVRDARRLAGWILTTTMRVVAMRQRSDQRQWGRQRPLDAIAGAEASGRRSDEAVLDTAAASIRPMLDDAIAALSPATREAVAGHYLCGENRTTLAQRLGISEEALKKRLAYGLEGLRRHLRRRGVATTALVITTVLCQDLTAAVARPLPSMDAAALQGVAPMDSGVTALMGAKAVVVTGFIFLAIALATAALFRSEEPESKTLASVVGAEPTLDLIITGAPEGIPCAVAIGRGEDDDGVSFVSHESSFDQVPVFVSDQLRGPLATVMPRLLHHVGWSGSWAMITPDAVLVHRHQGLARPAVPEGAIRLIHFGNRLSWMVALQNLEGVAFHFDQRLAELATEPPIALDWDGPLAGLLDQLGIGTAGWRIDDQGRIVWSSGRSL